MNVSISVVGDKKTSHVKPLHTIRNPAVIAREKYTSVDPNGKFINLVDNTTKSEKEFFNDVFKEYIDEYNSKQKRSCRKMDYDYYAIFKNSCRGKNTEQRPLHELILQIGNVDSHLSEKESVEILRKSFDEIINKYGNYIEVYAASIHLDESSPHLHIDLVFKAHNYKRGLKCQASVSKACKEMGFDTKFVSHNFTDSSGKINSGTTLQSAYINFQENGIRPIIEELVISYGHTVIRPMVEDAKHLETTQFHQLKSIESNKIMNDLLIKENELQAEIYQNYEKELSKLENKNKSLKKENTKLQSEISKSQATISSLKDSITALSPFKTLIDKCKQSNIFKSNNIDELFQEIEFLYSLKSKFTKLQKSYDNLVIQFNDLKSKYQTLKTNYDNLIRNH